MAPEVALEQPYNESCDVYSLAIVIWQIMALKTPFGKYSVKKMYQQVFKAPHSRPSLIGLEGVADGWLPLLLDNMWSSLISKRYTMDQVVTFLEEEEREIAQSYFAQLASDLLDE
jgi:serine/threonine protein kinase